MPAVGSLGPYVAVMLATGAANTLLMKFLVRQTVAPGPGQAPMSFDFPFFQTLLMMIGELMCLGAFAYTQATRKSGMATRTFSQLIIAVPVSCDWMATTLVNAAYVMIPASTIQMCRGCVVLFTCLFSVVFLGRQQQAFHYAGVALVAVGITIVSLDAVLHERTQSTGLTMTAAWLGVLLCIVGQVFQATMMVVEEKYMSSFNVPPLQMVGYEGLFGCAIGVVLLAVLQVSGVERATDATYMIGHSPALQAGCILSMFSIAFFNWSGVTVTQQASATARSTIDVCRTAIIWVVELLLAWNVFSWLQLVGFLVLIFGTLVYNEVLQLPGLTKEERPGQLIRGSIRDREQSDARL
jgi:drug/metabolite transporter (DMT)-like permease